MCEVCVGSCGIEEYQAALEVAGHLATTPRQAVMNLASLLRERDLHAPIIAAVARAKAFAEADAMLKEPNEWEKAYEALERARV